MFFKKKTPPPKKPAAPRSIVFKEYTIPYSKNFRGFKRFRVVVHGNKEAEINNEKYYDKDFSDSSFIFKCFNDEYGNRMAHLLIDGQLMGSVFDPDQLFAIENGLIEKIHIEPEEEVILGNKRTETRHRIRALVKYAKMDED